MSRFFRTVRAGVRGAVGGPRPSRFEAADADVACSHCRGEWFVEQEAQMNTAWATLLNLDWTNRSGTALVCTDCGLIQWFAKKPIRLDPE